MLIHWEGKDVEVPIEYSEMPLERRRKREEEDRDEEEDDVSEEEENEEDETEEEEYEEEDLDEKVFCHFKIKWRPPIKQRLNSPLRLTCNLSDISCAGVYPKENFILTNEGVYLDESFYQWTYFSRLDEQFRKKPPKRASWVYDWKDLPPVVGVVNDYTRRAILVQDVMGKSPIL
ncbi:unnamed protein product [Rhizophagus irregularis]|nr:unnamed protein product [Rhizophagus irregularis]